VEVAAAGDSAAASAVHGDRPRAAEAAGAAESPLADAAPVSASSSSSRAMLGGRELEGTPPPPLLLGWGFFFLRLRGFE
jgi:hypothetical protein